MSSVVKVALPEYFVALVLNKPSTTNKNGEEKIVNEHVHELCSVTKLYVQKHLQSTFANFHSLCLEFKAPVGDHKKPSDRFSHYWQATSTVTIYHKKRNGASCPSSETLFLEVGRAFNEGSKYLELIARDCGIFASEVEMRLLERPTGGGVVKAPNFYLGFECDPLPTARPAKEEERALVGLVFAHSEHELRSHFGDDFVGLDDLRVVRTEINEDAGKPFVKFNLYVEFEAMGTFRRNLPTSMDFYSSISNILSRHFLESVSTGVGGDFQHILRLAINPVAYIENLHEDEGDADADIVPVHVEFWIAMVIDKLKCAPNQTEIEAFDEMMKASVHETLEATYGKTEFQGLKSFEAACPIQHNAGLPLPRFNVLRKYKVDVNLRNPIPHPTAILKKIISLDIGSLIFKIINIDDSMCWVGIQEATMGMADVRKKTLATQSFGGKLKPKEATKSMGRKEIKNSTHFKSVDKPVKSGSTPTARHSKVKPQTKTPLQAPRQTAKPPLVLKTEDKQKPRIVQSNKRRFFILCTAFTIDRCRQEPTSDEFHSLKEATNIFFGAALRKLHMEGRYFPQSSPENITLSIRKHTYGKDTLLPMKGYNVAVEWDIDVQYSGEGPHPDSNELSLKLASKIDSMEYLVNTVRQLSKTVFRNATGIYIGQVRDTDTDP